MSKLNVKTLKLGDSVTEANNIQIKVPAAPDGSFSIEKADGTPIAAFAGASGTWSGNQLVLPVSANSGSFNMNSGNDFTCTPTGATTLTFSAYKAGQRGSIYLNNATPYNINITAGKMFAMTGAEALMSAVGKFWISYWCISATPGSEIVLMSVSSALITV